jgi:TPR repeat protein
MGEAIRSLKRQPAGSSYLHWTSKDCALLSGGWMRRQWIVLTALVAAGAALEAQSGSIDPALLAKANAGDPVAQVAVGEQYAQAAENEHDKARIAGDDRQELAWYRKAAEQKNIAGELHLAALYRDGAGQTVPRDMAQAAAWYRTAADQGDTSAQGTLGVLYSFGQGVVQNFVEAYFWLDLAASVGGPDQQKYVANRQMVGQHLTTDDVSSIEDRVAAWKVAHPRAGSD